MKRLLVLLIGGWLLAVTAVGAETDHGFPDAPDPTRHYVIYLHGGILTGTKGEAVSEQFGHYDYRGILHRFSAEGFEVIGEVRADDDIDRQVQKVVEWIQRLHRAGVPSRHIGVVGASMGGIIAGRVSARLKDRDLSYVLIASLYETASLPPLPLSGRVLSIRDGSDQRAWNEEQYLVPTDALREWKIVITETGRGHGLLYRPDEAWMMPTLEWLKATSPAPRAAGAGGP